MALNPKLSNAAATAEVNALAALLDGGTMEIYDGSQPSNADTAVTSQVKLSTLTFGSPAFAPGVDGVAVANPITADLSASATGTASWYRLKTSGGATVADGSVDSVAPANLILSSLAITVGAEVAVDEYSLTASKG